MECTIKQGNGSWCLAHQSEHHDGDQHEGYLSILVPWRRGPLTESASSDAALLHRVDEERVEDGQQ